MYFSCLEAHEITYLLLHHWKGCGISLQSAIYEVRRTERIWIMYDLKTIRVFLNLNKI